MKIAILGYGKMGKAIEEIALQQGHEIVFRASSANADFDAEELKPANAAIEFSRPETAVRNMEKCFMAGIPVIVGTTGWYQDFERIKQECLKGNHSLLYATNFSIGVNILFSLNKYLAGLMNKRPEYVPSMEEIHHTQKLDAPSGTAITLAEGIIGQMDHKNGWINEESDDPEKLSIVSRRIPDVPGTHMVKYESDIDELEIMHKAKNRKGFASGALAASVWIQGKKGIFTMQDILGI